MPFSCLKSLRALCENKKGIFNGKAENSGAYWPKYGISPMLKNSRAT